MLNRRTMPREKWQWFGSPGHFICARDCRFHLCTRIGKVLVSTVGEYLPDSNVRDILAQSRGIVLKGRGDDRLADWMTRCGYEDIGHQRKYETMVFRLSGKVCATQDCGCGLPEIEASGLDFNGYNAAGDATRGHYAMCMKWAKGRA